MAASNQTLHTCCFIGHRDICETEELKAQLCQVIEKLIVEEQVDTFLFGSKSKFNNLCYTLVTELKEKYPFIKRIYVRSEFPVISEDYKAYLLESYEQTYFPQSIIGAGRSVYVQRNNTMIDLSRFCVCYCQDGYAPKGRKSGTRIALAYAHKHKKTIYRFPVSQCPP